MPNSIWDHDLWESIYAIDEPKVKACCIALYRLILDMRESDVLAEKIAAKVSRRERIALTGAARVWAALVSILVVVQTILQIRHGG